ncbi:LCP family protein [Kyrpidia tusciae]|uniref:Cell envelope-related transcriptional attenuator n=1 Tax=Kyrpidia tusciae (strain DSM 2912 / NBRC 15312 / T2) TaxID=562970 RepID=D5WVV6_KYRT2|nr:LCP family protein [Kyrpidia tusciae]ADG07649.1 cell envelope-related transcriptional attenuator [Kyrpidia tusciae DSM 2912]
MAKRRRWLWIGAAVLLVVVLGMGGYYAWSIRHFVGAIQGGSADLPQWTGTERVNILMMGVDNRNHDPHPRSDTMVLVSVDPVTKTAQMFSIMRDTWYKIPGYGYEKINAGYAFGGPQLAVKTVEDFLQIPIHYYVVTDFVGFEKVVDAVGGVDLNVEKSMNYVDDGVYDIHLQAGYQHLDGAHALMYVRFRHDAESDFGRTQRQREFLLALANRLKAPSSIAKLPIILQAMEPYVRTNMNFGDMIRLAGLMRGVDISQVQTAQIPQNQDLLPENVDDQAVLIPHVAACRQTVHRMLGMADASTMTASASEDYYWNLYKDGGPAKPSTKVVAAPAPQPAPVPQPAPEPSTPAQESGNSSDQGTTAPTNHKSPTGNGGSSANDGKKNGNGQEQPGPAGGPEAGSGGTSGGGGTGGNDSPAPGTTDPKGSVDGKQVGTEKATSSASAQNFKPLHRAG